jgi:hypothetical protein
MPTVLLPIMEVTKMDSPNIVFRKEITNFVSASERLQSMLLQGERLSNDEAGVVRFCAVELLEQIPEPFLAERHS